MTEAEWLAAIDPLLMLAHLRMCGATDDRPLRLFAVACARRVWDVIDPLGRAAIDTAEAFADSRADADALRTARLACRSAGPGASWYAALSDPVIAARNAALSAQSCGRPGEPIVQAAFLRDIFGNPFQPCDVHRWRTPDIAALAATIDTHRSWEHLPKLATMLEVEGCNDRAILDHCRESGPHVRGCWVIEGLR